MPAAATLDLTVAVDKTKNVEVFVDLTVTKTVNIDVQLDQTYEGAAEAHALANVENLNNNVGPCTIAVCPGGPAQEGEFPAFNLDLEARLLGSVLTNEGIVGVNQDVGNMVNQANILAFARSEFTVEENRIVSDAEAEIDQVNSFNTVHQEESLPDLVDIFNDPDHEATIDASIIGNNGIVGVNQNAGNMNNQTNAVAMVIGEGNATVLTEASLGQENSNNQVNGIETVKVDLITGSINENNGVVSVNQSVGNMNNQGSAIAFGALKTTATVGVPGT
jgi:hypothetical protein